MPDKDVTLEFPVAGVNVAGEFERQPPRTCARGANVRANEALTTRQRGGSRPGLSKYIPDPVDGTAGHPVQHLNAIVDPTVAAVLASFESYDDPGTGTNPGVDDPSDGARNPSRLVRPGGSGVQPNRHVSQRRGGGTTRIQYRQSTGATFDFPGGSHGTTRADTLAFPTPVLRKSLVVVVLNTENPAAIAAQTQHAIADSLGLVWRESPASYEAAFPVGAGNYNGAMRLWWTYADFLPASSALSVTVTTTATPDPVYGPLAPNLAPAAMAVLEYINLPFFTGGSTALLDDQADFHTGNTTGSGTALTFDPGDTLDPATNAGLYLAAFGTGAGLPANPVLSALPQPPPSSTPAFRVRLNVSSGVLVVLEGIGGLAGTPQAPQLVVDYSGGGGITSLHWAAQLASFRSA